MQSKWEIEILTEWAGLVRSKAARATAVHTQFVDIDDMVQEMNVALVRAARTWAQKHGESKPPAKWLMFALKACAISLYRKSCTRPTHTTTVLDQPIEGVTAAHPVAPDFVDHLEYRAETRQFVGAVQLLERNMDDRNWFILQQLQADKKPREIALALGTSNANNSMSVQIFRAKQKGRKVLRQRAINSIQDAQRKTYVN